MKVSAVVILLLLPFAFTREPQFIDFTYTHVLQEAGSSSDPTQAITIYPDTHQVEKYDFPQICDLKGKLLEGMDNSSAVTSAIDVDDHLRDLRSRVLTLLKLAEQMKNLKITLQEIDESYDQSTTGFTASIFTSDLSRLVTKQQELANLREKIENSTLKLNLLIDQYNLNPKSQQFSQVNIRYKLTLANAKINFYKKLKDDSSAKRASQKPVNYDEFFSEIETSFENVNKHLSDIDSIIDNYSTKKKLQEKISSYHNKIEIDRLLLNEKVDCNSSKTKFRTHKGLKQEIKKTFQDLRQKKKEFAGMNNTQCEGVSKKLEEKIRSELKIINRAYICSQGLQQIKDDLRKSENDLENLNKKLKDLQLGDISVYQKGYNKSIADIEIQLKKAKSFKVEQYIHSEQELSKLLAQAVLQKEQAEKDLQALPDKTGSKVSFKQLEQLVQQIKREKAKYCKEYADYEHDQRDVWSKIYRAEKRQRELAHVRSHYISQAQKYIELQAQYNQLSKQINYALLQGGSNL